MIEIEIIKSNDIEAVGKYHFGFDEIKIGRILSSDVIIRDEKWRDKSFIFRITEEGLKVINKSTDYFTSNKKLISGSKVHKSNDVIEFEGTEIKIINFQKTTPATPDISALYKEHIEKNPESVDLIKNIENELRKLNL